jgi:hypothetical protein
MVETYTHQLNKIEGIKKQVQHLHPALERLYPVVIAENDQLFIYNTSQGKAGYSFIKFAPSPMPIPVGIRAAFPLEAYGQRIACVITPEIFDSLEGYVTILHEFVHCYQFETCEQRLKMTLDVARRAQETNNSMWEIEYPFPYNAIDFIRPYTEFMAAAQTYEAQKIQSTRKQLRTYLGLHDFEYMVWQEWKEGLARWVENKIKGHLGLPTSTKGIKEPYSRVTFYAGGASYIDYFSAQDPPIVNDITRLFAKMVIT